MTRKPVETTLTYDWDGTRATRNRNMKLAAVGGLPCVLIGLLSLSMGF